MAVVSAAIFGALPMGSRSGAFKKAEQFLHETGRFGRSGFLGLAGGALGTAEAAHLELRLLVVKLAFLGVDEVAVGFHQFFHFGFGVELVVGVEFGMVFFGEIAVGLADALGRGNRGDVEDEVVIARIYQCSLDASWEPWLDSA